VPKVVFGIESLINNGETQNPEGDLFVSAGEFSEVVNDPFDKSQVLKAMQQMILKALTKLNLKASTLSIVKDPETQKLVFVSST
jgi:hypothetical protein